MRKSFLWVFFLVLICGEVSQAQVAPSAIRHQRLTVNVGGMFSGFLSDYAAPGTDEKSNLAGAGGYVDAQLTRWIGAEAEARWMPWDQHYELKESQYLIGPRVPIKRVGRYLPYGKVLFGANKMKVVPTGANGRFTDIAFGGGLDVRMSHKLTLRAVDFEFQDLPSFPGKALHPYGASVGVSYRIF